MPSYFYELITICFHLSLKNKRLPSMYEVADALSVSYSAVVNRVHKMVKFGYLRPYDRYCKADWFHLTVKGAIAYMDCLKGDRFVFFDPSVGALSPVRYARHPDALYKQLSRRDYTAQVQKIAEHGPTGATI